MAEESPTLLFIGRNGSTVDLWPKVRHLWQPGKALRVSQAYGGLALLFKHDRLRLVVVGVDELSEREMSFFSAASRHCPQLRILAFGKGDQLTNPRLADATWHGASEALNAEQLIQKLSHWPDQPTDLPRPTRPSTATQATKLQSIAPTIAQQPEIQTPVPAEPEPQTIAPTIAQQPETQSPAVAQPEPDALENLLAERSVTENRRKAPVAPEPKERQISCQDVVTPEELRMLLGEEGEQP